MNRGGLGGLSFSFFDGSGAAAGAGAACLSAMMRPLPRLDVVHNRVCTKLIDVSPCSARRLDEMSEAGL
jgi:hypothetical protein